MSEDKDQIINDLKAELEKTRADYQSYKDQCKQIQELLEADVKKKQGEIKKIKEDFLKKEKGFGEHKNKIAELEKDSDAKTKTIADLNDQLSKFTNSAAGQGDKIAKLEEQLKNSEKKASDQADDIAKRNQYIVELNKQIADLKAELQKRDADLKIKTQQIEKAKNQQISQLHEQIASLQKQLESAGTAKKAEPKKEKDQAGHGSAQKAEMKQLRQQNDKLTNLVQSLQKDLARAKESSKIAKKVEKTEEVDVEQYKKLQRSFRELKAKYTEINEQKKNMSKTFREIEKKHQQELANLKEVPNQIAEPEETRRNGKQNSFYVLIKTKKHYISPFLEWNTKTLKLLKQTKTAFSKSLGCLKYNADYIGYDPVQIISSIVEGLEIENYKEKDQPNTVIIYGNKKTSKKAILLGILKQLSDRMLALKESDPDFKIKFRAYKAKLNEPPIFDRTLEESGDLSLSGCFQELNEIFSAKEPQDSPATKKLKLQRTKPKPKEQIRYVSIEINESYKIQLITSSNCNAAGFKQHDTLQNSLQHLIFAYLPPEFHCSVVSTRHIVLPISPIVQQYDSCKMSLSLINQQYNVPKFDRTYDYNEEPVVQSPVKEDSLINDSVKKKIQNIERDNEQAGIKIIRLEQDCAYYRARIQDFVVRIKNIISTQNKQNSYLKKSPMTLTLQKLEQSMSSILRKTTQVGRTSTFEKDRPEESLHQEPEVYDQQAEPEENGQESVDVL